MGLLADWTIGTGSNQIPVIVGLTYHLKPKLFHGRLVLLGDPIFQLKRYPGYDWRLSQAVLGYPGISNITPTLSLWELFTAGERGSPPSEMAKFPFALAAADVTYQSFNNNTSGSGSTVTFSLDIAAGPQPQENTDAAPSWFPWDEVSISFTRTPSTPPGTPAAPAILATQTATVVQATPAVAATATTTTSMQIYSGVSLNSKPPKLLPPATLDVALSYDSSTDGPSDWTLQGSLSNRSVKLLANIFFNDHCSSGAMAVLGELNLSRLDVSLFL